MKTRPCKRIHHIACFAVVFLPATGCYTYDEISVPAQTTGDEIEIITTSHETYLLQHWSIDSGGTICGTRELRPVSEDGMISGRTVVMAQPVAEKSDCSQATVSIPARDVLRMREKRLDKGRTAAASLGVAAAAYGVLLMVQLVRAYEQTGRSVSPPIGAISIGPW